MNEIITVYCYHCWHEYKVKKSNLGRTVTCKSCSEEFELNVPGTTNLPTAKVAVSVAESKKEPAPKRSKKNRPTVESVPFWKTKSAVIAGIGFSVSMVMIALALVLFFSSQKKPSMAAGWTKNNNGEVKRTPKPEKPLEGTFTRCYNLKTDLNITYRYTLMATCEGKEFHTIGSAPCSVRSEKEVTKHEEVDGEIVPVRTSSQILMENSEECFIAEKDTSQSELKVSDSQWIIASPEGYRQDRFHNRKPGGIDPVLLMPTGGIAVSWIGKGKYNRSGLRDEYNLKLPIWFQIEGRSLFDHRRKKKTKQADHPEAKVYIEDDLYLVSVEGNIFTCKKFTTVKSNFRKENAMSGWLETTYQFDSEKGLIVGGSARGAGHLKLEGVTKPYKIEASWKLASDNLAELKNQKKKESGLVKTFRTLKPKEKFENAYRTAFVGNQLILANEDAKLELADLKQDRILDSSNLGKRIGFSKDVKGMWYIKEKQQVLLNRDEQLEFWGIENGKLKKIGNLIGAEGVYVSANFLASKEQLVTVKEDGSVQLWSTDSFEKIKEWKVLGGNVAKAFFVNGGKEIFYVGTHRWYRIDIAKDEDPKGTFYGESCLLPIVMAPATNCMVLPVGRKILVMNQDGKIVQTILQDSDKNCVFCLSNDGKRLYGFNGKLTCWDVRNGKRLNRWSLRKGSFPEAIAISEDEKTICLQSFLDARVFRIKE